MKVNVAFLETGLFRIIHVCFSAVLDLLVILSHQTYHHLTTLHQILRLFPHDHMLYKCDISVGNYETFSIVLGDSQHITCSTCFPVTKHFNHYIGKVENNVSFFSTENTV